MRSCTPLPHPYLTTGPFGDYGVFMSDIKWSGKTYKGFNLHTVVAGRHWDIVHLAGDGWVIYADTGFGDRIRTVVGIVNRNVAQEKAEEMIRAVKK